MAYHKREPSKDITSHAHPTPLPTYFSQQLPRWTSKSSFEDQKAFEAKEEPSFGYTVRTDPIVPSYSHKTEPFYPHKTQPFPSHKTQPFHSHKAEPFIPGYSQFPAPMPRFDSIPLPPRPQRQRQLPRKAILIPWILAAVFFLTTLWFTSIALGVRLFMVMQPAASTPPVQEIRVFINGDVLQSTASAIISVPVLTAAGTAPTSTSGGIIVPTATGGLDTAAAKDFTTAAPLPRSLKARPTGFITIARMA
ncbi:hypothetical protein G6514_002180 [Epicoccum nigrum]|nr:hypothetical protein G6514_002180 [Epicoccum nigrum]